MRIRTYTVLTIMVFSSGAFGWQPLTYPIRSQSAYQRSVDNALCFAAANRQTKVNIAREPQIPPRKPPAAKSSSTGAPSRPPLPSSSFSSTPMGASMPSAASAATATPASTTRAASATTASAPATSAAADANDGASETTAASAPPTTAASNVKLPPLPAPEPPMTQYWAAYGACMQARGYVVAQ
ncbi:hypothetical protein [Paraburkholderia terricola]|uniref:hypothetical protein n=1 Tax=Paraburkholderia terricola TaxID=169427 RepID=UPI0009F581AC|nr:hypothetical protein [Paraburkholderia terricola]ORC47962.1 hypothetical protein B2G74_20150 [Burkholderia sp. A27]